MATVVSNIAKGRVGEFFHRVKNNDPTNAALIVVPINSTATDDVLRGYDDLSALIGDANTSELTAGGWARKTLVDTDIAALAPDDTNDRYDYDITADLDFGAIAASNNSTDLVLCYDSDTTAGTDANIIPLVIYDFAVTTDGSNVTATRNAAGLFRAS